MMMTREGSLLDSLRVRLVLARRAGHRRGSEFVRDLRLEVYRDLLVRFGGEAVTRHARRIGRVMQRAVDEVYGNGEG